MVLRNGTRGRSCAGQAKTHGRSCAGQRKDIAVTLMTVVSLMCWQRDAVNVCADLREELCGRGKDSRHQQSVERDAHALHRRQRQVHRLDRRECLPSVHMRMGLLARVHMRACAARRRARTQVVVCGCVQRSEQTEAMLPVPARPSRRLSSAISPVGVNCK